MRFSDNNHTIKKIRKKPVIPSYLKQYEKYLRDPFRKPADGTIQNFVYLMNRMDMWLRENSKFRHRYNGSWKQVIKDGPLLYLGQTDLERFFRKLFNENKSLKYRQSFKVAYNSFLKFVKRHKNVDFTPDYTYLPFKKTPSEMRKKSKQYLSADHIALIRDKLYKAPLYTPVERLRGLRNLAIFELLVTTGMRKNELVKIECSNIDFDKKRIYVFGSKTAQIKDGWRYVPFQESARDAVKIYLQEFRFQTNITVQKYLFAPPGAMNGSNPMLSSLVDGIVHRWQKYIDIPLHPHLFRHYYATQLTSRVDVKDAAILLGDEIHTIIKRYYHPDSKDSVNKLIDMEFSV